MSKTAWTDYPIAELGDAPGKVAPIRECTILTYDGDKYVEIEVGGCRTHVKAGYLYQEPGRLGDVATVSRSTLRRVAATKD